VGSLASQPRVPAPGSAEPGLAQRRPAPLLHRRTRRRTARIPLWLMRASRRARRLWDAGVTPGRPSLITGPAHVISPTYPPRVSCAAGRALRAGASPCRPLWVRALCCVRTLAIFVHVLPCPHHAFPMELSYAYLQFRARVRRPAAHMLCARWLRPHAFVYRRITPIAMLLAGVVCAASPRGCDVTGAQSYGQTFSGW